MQIAGIGRVVFWEGGSLWLALITGGVERHVHHAIQISLPFDGAVRFQISPDADWMSYAGAVIGPDLPHAFQAPGRIVANILFEPESTTGRAMLAKFANTGVTALPAELVASLVAPLAAAYFAGASDDELVTLAKQAITDISGSPFQAGATDPRVLRAIAHIRDHVDEPILLSTLAGTVGLSPGRFRHLFVAQTGVSSKAFILWERLNKALALGFGGLSWTEAAHAANFADSAHLSRTCRRMFGLAPTSGRVERPEALRQLSA